MIGHSDITKDGSPVGRVVVDTDKKTMTILVLESVAGAMSSVLMATAKPPAGFEVILRAIPDDHFFELFE